MSSRRQRNRAGGPYLHNHATSIQNPGRTSDSRIHDDPPVEEFPVAVFLRQTIEVLLGQTRLHEDVRRFDLNVHATVPTGQATLIPFASGDQVQESQHARSPRTLEDLENPEDTAE